MHHRIFQTELDRVKKTCIARALLMHQCVGTKAARELGISRRTLQLWLKRLGLARNELTELTHAASDESVPTHVSLRHACELFEEHKIADALESHGRSRTHTAIALGISRRTLIKKIGKYELA